MSYGTLVENQNVFTATELGQAFLQLNTEPWCRQSHETLGIATQLAGLLDIAAPLPNYLDWWTVHLPQAPTPQWEAWGSSLLGSLPPSLAHSESLPIREWVRREEVQLWLTKAHGVPVNALRNATYALDHATVVSLRSVDVLQRDNCLYRPLPDICSPQLPPNTVLFRGRERAAAAVLTTGDAILVLPDKEPTTPAAVAELIHELTHIAHLRDQLSQGKNLHDVTTWQRESIALRAELGAIYKLGGEQAMQEWLRQGRINALNACKNLAAWPESVVYLGWLGERARALGRARSPARA